VQITLLDNKKSIKQLVGVDTNKSILEFIEKELDADEYNFIVTSENLPFAKKAMAGLNKSKDFITAFRKDKVNAESVAIDTFKDNVKEYIALIESKREKIKKDVEVFETKAKDSITKELSLYCEESLTIQKIRFEFNEVKLSDLIVLGSVTSKCALTKKAKETIEGRVMACKSKQDKYDMRLLALENESRKSGLEAILTITHVQGIIMIDDDNEYNVKLNELISSEIDRQNTIKANLQRESDERANREAQQRVINEQNRIKNIFAVNFDNLTIDSIDMCIENFENLINDDYGDYKLFALEYFAARVNKLTDIRANIVQSNQISESKKEIPVVHENIPYTQEEKSEQIKNVSVENVEVGKKVVLIDVHLQFKVKDTIADDKIIDKVNSMLKAAGFDESLIGVEVVQ